MLLNIIYLIGGLALILIGANALTDGASALAKRWGVSELVIGLTIVAFGTSAPELVISIVSAIQGNTGIAVGNVVGSNICNILVIIGVVAMVKPMRVEKSILSNEIPLVMLSSFALLAIGCGGLLGVPGDVTVSRVDGILLLLFFLVFLRYTFAQAKGQEASVNKEVAVVEADAGGAVKEMKMGKAVIWVAGGLAALIFGGDVFVDGASGLASSFGVSDAIIGLTIVAIGTSLPELATSVSAARKGQTGIALGNVIGSCVFNAFMVLGASATIRPLPFGSIGLVDMLTLAVASVLFWVFGRCFGNKVINRWEGAVMFMIYVAYIVWLISGAV